MAWSDGGGDVASEGGGGRVTGVDLDGPVSTTELRTELVAEAVEQLGRATDGLRADLCNAGGLTGVAGTAALVGATRRLSVLQSRLATEGALRTTQAAEGLQGLAARTRQVDRFGG